MPTALIWFRRDLRLSDHPALHAALAGNDHIIPVYIHAPEEEAPWQPGGASRWWLHHSLTALDAELHELGSRLIIRQGPTQPALARLIEETGAGELHWGRLYDPATIARDKVIKAWAREQGLAAHSHNTGLLHEPWTVQTQSGGPYKVFTPFWKTCQALPGQDMPLAPPDQLPAVDATLASEPLASLQLLPKIAWDTGLAENWRPGEHGAQALLSEFLDQRASDYQRQRDLPAKPGTSRLSPHLHFGEISPRQIWWQCQQQAADAGTGAFLREVYWREFSFHLLYHFPRTPEQPLNPKFAEFPWTGDYQTELEAWQRGRTGIPIVDAGMRELWHTGWMHNRVRMLVASLLTKNLLIPWQEGARWFWDTLVDADLANNTQGWQWTAGCGADAAPYFRIFNPALQGEKFDPNGDYVRRWLPELASLPDKWIHKPWQAPAEIRRTCPDYPEPMVDLRASRERALEIWDDIKSRAG